MFTITAPEITESSALAVSTVKPRLVYTINDSGDGANVYVLDSSDGDLVGTTTLAGVDARDIEAIATGDGRQAGGGRHRRQQGRPPVGDALSDRPARPRGPPGHRPTTVSLTYANGPRDAEAILYDAETGRVYVISKQFGGAKVFRTPPDVFSRTSAVLEADRAGPGSGDRRHVPARWGRGRDPHLLRRRRLSLPELEEDHRLRAAESAAGRVDHRAGRGDEVWVGSEGADSQVLAVPLPDLSPEGARRRRPRSAPPTRPDESERDAGSDNDQLEAGRARS